MKTAVLINNEKPKCKFIDFKSHINSLKNNKTILMCLFLTVLYLISGYWQWLEIVVALCAVTFMAIIPLQNAFCIFMFMHCFTQGSHSRYSGFMFVLIGFCLVLIVKYVIGLIRQKYEIHRKIILSIAFFYITTIIFSMFSAFMKYTILYLTYLPIAYCIFAMRDEFDIKQAMNFLFGGMLLSCSLSILFDFTPGFNYTSFHVNSEKRFRGFVNHTNCLYIRAIFILSYFIYRFLDNQLNAIDFTLCYISCSAVSILTKSKTAICLLLLFTTLLIVLYLKKDFKKNIKFVLIFMLSFLLVCGIFYKQVWQILQRFGSAFTSNNFWNEILTDRDVVWEKYANNIFSGFRTTMFGNGIHAKRLYFNYYGYIDPHNSYLFLLYHFGIVGTISLGLIIHHIIKESCYFKPQFIACIPLIFMLIESFCENLFKFYNFSFFICAVMIMFATQKDEILKLKKTRESKLANKGNKISKSKNQTTKHETSDSPTENDFKQ